MPDLTFQVEGAEAVPYAAAPMLALKLRIGATGEPVYAMTLRCQIRIEPTRRRYDPASHNRLFDLFGTPKDWGRTVRAMLWTHLAVNVPAFTGSTVVELPIPCSYDFTIAATKYFDALDDGEVPLSLLFSGTVFYSTSDGSLQVEQVPWEKEATFRLPIGVWRNMMNHYYPNSAWLCLRKDVFDRLASFKSRGAYTSWEEALIGLLPAAERETP